MRRFLLVLVLVMATAAAVPAEFDDPAATITAQERDWAAAAVTKDLDAIDRLLHEHFRLVPLYNPDLGVTVRTDYLKYQRADPDWAFRAMTPVVIEVDLRGKIAISTVNMTVGWPENVSMPIDFRFTDVWVQHDGKWRVISRFSERR